MRASGATHAAGRMITTRIAMAIGAGTLAVTLGLGYWYGEHMDGVGYARALAEVKEQNENERRKFEDRINAAELLASDERIQRQRVEDTLALGHLERNATVARLTGLLATASSKSKLANAGGGYDATGPDWIGVFAECVALVDENATALGRVAGDAAKWADQINRLHRYIYAVQPGAPRPKP